jgi:hypothetical protein
MAWEDCINLRLNWVSFELLNLFQLDAALTKIRGEHHDRFSIPGYIHEPVAVHRSIDKLLDYRAGWDRGGMVLSINSNDRQC